MVHILYGYVSIVSLVIVRGNIKMKYIKKNERKNEYGFECGSCGSRIIMTLDELDIINIFGSTLCEINGTIYTISSIPILLDNIVKCCDNADWNSI